MEEQVELNNRACFHWPDNYLINGRTGSTVGSIFRFLVPACLPGGSNTHTLTSDKSVSWANFSRMVNAESPGRLIMVAHSSRQQHGIKFLMAITHCCFKHTRGWSVVQ